MITADKTFLRSHYKKKRFSLTKQEVDDLIDHSELDIDLEVVKIN